MKMHVSLDFTAEADTISEMMEQAYEAIGVVQDLPFVGHVGFYISDENEPDEPRIPELNPNDLAS